MKRGTLQFTVDSALLKELGERLVGRPSIALGELVKNSYDADATRVVVSLQKEDDCIIVDDNGHGMTFDEFKKFWMRIGSTHKRRQRVSRKLKRNMTGSKGVGRLAVQFLAEQLEISTCSERSPGQLLSASVDWTEAVRAEQLTSAEVKYSIEPTEERTAGTKLVLRKLNTGWSDDEIRNLARQIWWLQPPFRSDAAQLDPAKAFKVEFVSHESLVDLFNRGMNAILDNWYARIVGENNNGHVSLSIEWAGEASIPHDFRLKGCKLGNGDFEIRVYHLFKRQPSGIPVGQAREYLNEFGGVNVYDGGFRLPYYGDKENDWLAIEQDHSHRKTVSSLLPEALREGLDRGLQFLPTLSRIVGVVNVETSQEEDLDIVVTRDRFRLSDAYIHLKSIIRYSLDLYALWEKKRALERDMVEIDIPRQKAQRVESILEKYKDEIPSKTYSPLRKEVVEVLARTDTEAERTSTQIALWGALATAGITSLAYQHETKRQFRAIESVIETIDTLQMKIKGQKLRSDLRGLSESLSSWVTRARQTNALFTHLADPENLDFRKRFLMKQTLEDVWFQVEALAPKVRFKADRIDSRALLPKASFAEWSAILQNVYINAFNAMFHLKRRVIDVSLRSSSNRREILVQDTGYGVDLRKSEKLFEPFIRKSKLPPSMKALGYGGTGLGLTIVRLIARNIGCEVSFVKPEGKFRTAFSIRWNES